MSISRADTGIPRTGLQRALCALGFHSFEKVGSRTDIGHRFSEAHETLYEVRRERLLLRCEHCGTERVRHGRPEEIEVGHYERIFVRK